MSKFKSGVFFDVGISIGNDYCFVFEVFSNSGGYCFCD